MSGGRFRWWFTRLVRGVPDALARREWRWAGILLLGLVAGPALWLWNAPAQVLTAVIRWRKTRP